MDAPDLETSLDDTAGVLDGILHSHRPEIRVDDVGTVSFVGQGIVRVTGLRGVNRKNSSPSTDDLLGMAFNLDEKETGVILLDESTALFAGSEARRTGRVMDIPVGEALLGRVLDAKGRPLDGGEPIDARTSGARWSSRRHPSWTGRRSPFPCRPVSRWWMP
jgi:F-type H+-transporting ATPase subunit alpha